MLPLLLGALGALALGARRSAKPSLPAATRRRLGLTADGRITKGLPEPLLGLRAEVLPALRRELGRLAREESSCEQSATVQRRRTFDRKDDGTRALLASNPELHELLETDCSNACRAYRRWVAGGRRGSKPRPGVGEGRFDPIDVGLDRRGGRRIASWLEAVHAVVPPSRHWQDFGQRLPYLEEATGLPLVPPTEAERLLQQEVDRARCREGAEAGTEEMLDLARAGQLRRGPRRATDVPF